MNHKTNHPTIKYIKYGNKFVTNKGDVLTFVSYDSTDDIFVLWCDKCGGNNHEKIRFYLPNLEDFYSMKEHIVLKCVSLKEKLEQI